MKNALINGSMKDDYKPIVASTAAIFFLATPHHGSYLSSWVTIAQNVVSWAMLKQRSSKLADELTPFSNTLQGITVNFADVAKGFAIRSFQEQKPTRLPPPEGSRLIVEPGAAQMGHPSETVIPLPENHSTICKFSSPDNSSYEAVCDELVYLAHKVEQEKIKLRELESRLQNENLRVPIRNWLSEFSNSSASRQRDLFDSHTLGTGNWFLDSPEFAEWTRGEASTLECPGDPGTGKSVLAYVHAQHFLVTITNDS